MKASKHTVKPQGQQPTPTFFRSQKGRSLLSLLLIAALATATVLSALWYLMAKAAADSQTADYLAELVTAPGSTDPAFILLSVLILLLWVLLTVFAYRKRLPNANRTVGALFALASVGYISYAISLFTNAAVGTVLFIWHFISGLFAFALDPIWDRLSLSNGVTVCISLGLYLLAAVANLWLSHRGGQAKKNI